MDRGAWQAMVHGVAELDRTEVSEYACMKLRADPTAKELRINREEAGGLEQREAEKREPEPESKAEENATEQTGRAVGFAASRGQFSHLQVSGEVPRWGDSLKLISSLLLGVFPKPSISAHPGPLVHEGENVTLRCNSSTLLDKFILHKTSSTGHFQRCEETLTGGHAPADFVIGSMTLASVGSYTCYGSLSHSPYEGQHPVTPWTSSSQVSVTRPVPSALCVMEGLVSSPASVPGENDRPAETLTNSGEGANQRKRSCESRRVREESPCRVLRGRHSR